MGSAIPNRTFLFKSVPQGLSEPGRHIAVEDASYGATADCPSGGIFVRALYASIDPYHRSNMRDASVKSYQPALAPGASLIARSLATVLRSDNSAYKPGDTVVGPMPIQEYVALDGPLLGMTKPLDNALDIEDIREFLGTLGVPGLTAFGGLYEIGKPSKGETIFISAASGAVGQVVGQLAKIEGLRVIGSVGSQEKLDYITSELGFDAGFNYKEESPSSALARLAPDGIDLYWDNVGGEHLDAALLAMNDFGRVVMCGTISEYNHSPEKQYPLRAYSKIFSKRLTLRGFIVSDKDIAPKYAQEHQKKVQKYVKDGIVRSKIWEVCGIENAPRAFVDLFTGSNFGKTVLRY